MITAKRDNRTVYHWPASLRALIKARDKANKKNASQKSVDDYDKQASKARIAATKWQLCACGSLCSAIPRIKGIPDEWVSMSEAAQGIDIIPRRYAPKDDELMLLGFDFNNQIMWELFEDALKTLALIERRAGQVLRAMGKTKKRYGKPILK